MKVYIPIVLMVVVWLVLLLLATNRDSPKPGYSLPPEPAPERLGREWD